MVDTGHLDRLEASDLPGAGFGIHREFVLHIGDGPDATNQQLWKAFDVGVLDRNLLDSKVGELHLVEARLLVERDGELVDHLVATSIFDRGFDQFRLVSVHVVLSQDAAYRFEAVFDLIGVVSGAVLAEQVLEHVGGHHRVLLELGGEVFAHHQAREVLKDLLIQGAVGGRGADAHGLSEVVEVVAEGLEQLHLPSFEANRRLHTLQHPIDSELE